VGGLTDFRSSVDDAENGRGLLLFDAISDQWGRYPARDEVGKVVWALI